MEEKNKFTTYAYIEFDKCIVQFEAKDYIVIDLGNKLTLYINKFDLQAYQYKNTFLFKPKKEKNYTIYNNDNKTKKELNAEEITNLFKDTVYITKRINIAK